MARKKSMVSIEAEISKAKEVVLTTKVKHEAAIAHLEATMAKKDERIAQDLLEAYKKSGKSYDTVMRFLGEGLRA